MLYEVITLLGDEDHLGDMDFKFAGTEQGMTALQMDITIQGITREIMDIALGQAREARLHILGEMGKVIDAPREEMSEWAPTIMTFKIDPEKIRDVIGKGGSVIRAMTEETGATIDIDQDGTVRIASVDGSSGKEARRRIEFRITSYNVCYTKLLRKSIRGDPGTTNQLSPVRRRRLLSGAIP